MSDFVGAARAAFADLAAELRLELTATRDGEWAASVEWQRGPVRLEVTDDARDRLVEVFILRPRTTDERSAGVLVRGDDISLPLWAIVDAADGRATSTLMGDTPARLGGLPLLADAARTYGHRFLTNIEEPIDGVLAVVERNAAASSDESHKARRWLP